MDETTITTIEDFYSGELSSPEVSAETEVIDYPALMGEGMKDAFIVCGVALVLSLGVAVAIKLFKL